MTINFLPSPLIVLSHTSQQLVHLISRGRNIFPMLINYPIVGLWIHLGYVTIKLQLEWRSHSKKSIEYFQQIYILIWLETVWPSLELVSFYTHTIFQLITIAINIFHTLPWLDLSEDCFFPNWRWKLPSEAVKHTWCRPGLCVLLLIVFSNVFWLYCTGERWRAVWMGYTWFWSDCNREMATVFKLYSVEWFDY